MSDDSELQSDDQQPADRDRDWVLGELVEMQNAAEGRGLPISITLMVGGLLVSGRLIGGAEYFDQYSDFWSNMMPDDLKDSVKSHFGGPATMYGPDGERNPNPNYIHLAEARTFAAGGNPIPGNQGVYWRGKLASVDGFWIGQLQAETN